MGDQGQTTTVQGHVEGTVEWVEGLEVVATGLVPGFADYPSSMTVESEQVGVLVVVRERATHLSVDEDVVEGGREERSRLTEKVVLGMGEQLQTVEKVWVGSEEGCCDS